MASDSVLRIECVDQPQWNLLVLAGIFQDISELVRVACIWDALGGGSDPVRIDSLTWRGISSSADDVAGGVRVRRLSYQSPLTLWVELPLLASGALAIGNRLIALSKSYNAARVVKARADFVVAAYRVLEAVTINDVKSQDDQSLVQPSAAESRRVDAAARALQAIDSVRFDDLDNAR